MPSGPLLALHPRPRRGLHEALLALAGALLVAFSGAAPAGAVSTTCSLSVGTGSCFYGEDEGAGVVPGNPADPTLASQIASAAFRSAIGPSQTESFEGPGFPVASQGPLDIFGGFGMLTDTVADSGSIRDFSDADRGFAITGEQFWKNTTTSKLADELFAVTFDDPVRAFGFFANAYSTESSPNDDATRLVLEFWSDFGRKSLLARVEIPHLPDERPGSIFFVGVLADVPFLAVSLRNDSTTDPGDRIGFDDFTVAVVPEPATALMLLGGLLGLAAFGRRSVWRRPHSPNAAATIAGGAASAPGSAPRRW